MSQHEKLILPKVSNVGIVYRIATPAASTLAKALSKWLKVRNHNVYTMPEQKVIAGTKATRGTTDLKKLHLVVVLGGDGTYLRAVRILKGMPIPILGVNLGSLGYLTPTRAEETFTAVESALNGKMELWPRSMLNMTLFRKRKKKSEFFALNDVVLERGSLSQLINMGIYVDGTFVKDVRADGLIIATPTGSTAYNLSAGGPILHPEVNAIVVSPVAPHSLTSRPLIFPDTNLLSFKLVKKLQGPISKALGYGKTVGHLIIDGENMAEVTIEDEIRITRSKRNHHMVVDPDHDGFELLRQKLRFGDRE